MNTLRAANDKFKKGDNLTNHELNLLLAHYTTLSEQLDAMDDPHYHLVRNDVWHNFNRLREYRKARDEK